ncbi:response regulator [Flavihumibacter sp. RY-1]|uniref:Response regulator n=1 Tax=Flavihumibacter fluminis TaxID=2909236 RepID=A0ABS9BKR6_9BACT|nr:response regulator [Flavihumibacter fluminis]MCF1716286.1 response regulator [Flavihumibacter fluminis]
MKEFHILLVEDNEGDILMTSESIQEYDPGCHIEVARNGQEAIEKLQSNMEDPLLKKPDLILLDINLPRKNGHEVVAFIKNQLYLSSIPVVILTTSSAPLDIQKAYQAHANSYLTKPTEAEEFSKMVAALVEFWKRNVHL